MIDFLLRNDLLPDAAIRAGIRRLLRARLREEAAPTDRDLEQRLQSFASGLGSMPIAVNTADSREQHYEVPTEFYKGVLGPRLKYSCCWFAKGDETLAEAEEAMLALTADRARIADHQEILELGCGWGSLTLWMAERHPRSRITGVSHSRTQKEHIDSEARRRGLGNVTIITSDMNDFDIDAGRFDRVISVEMFEHMKNWPGLYLRIARWLRPEGLFFMHVFAHSRHAYHFVARDRTDWMSRYFFTGGMMPSWDLAPRFQEDLRLVGSWRVPGRHYQRTAELWLENMDRNRERLEPVLAAAYGAPNAVQWRCYWRTFLMSCAELWGFRGGSEWIVGHYLFSRRR